MIRLDMCDWEMRDATVCENAQKRRTEGLQVRWKAVGCYGSSSGGASGMCFTKVAPNDVGHVQAQPWAQPDQDGPW